MYCKDYSNLISDFIENELDAQTADEVSLHVFACPRCENELENLTRETEIYSQFLFEIEPPRNLSNEFQARLENEFGVKPVVSDLPKISFVERLANLFSLRNSFPAMAALGFLVLFVFGFFGLKNPSNENAESKSSITGKANQILPVDDLKEEVKESLPKEFTPETAKAETKPAGNSEKVSFEKIKAAESKREKSALVKVETRKEKTFKNSDAAKVPVLSEDEKLRLSELQAFEQQTARQMEKIEMLLRSFRNARFSEETERYDVSFEKQQARKFLETNENLRAQAETYGDFPTKELLDKIEPYLLDIANLETNPSTEMVLDIKQRVRNQNLIASLQGF